MAIYKILTKEEKETLKQYEREYKIDRDEDKYLKRVEKYIDEINYADRLSEYLKDKWYFKLLLFILRKLDKKGKE